MTDTQETIDLALKSITQPRTSYLRDHSIEPSKRARVGQNIGNDDESQTTFFSQMSVRVFGRSDGDIEDGEPVAFSFESDVRVELQVRPGQEDRLSDAHEITGVFDLVRRLADPYHRQTLADSMARAGLPLITLPLPQAEGWESTDDASGAN